MPKVKIPIKHRKEAPGSRRWAVQEQTRRPTGDQAADREQGRTQRPLQTSGSKPRTSTDLAADENKDLMGHQLRYADYPQRRRAWWAVACEGKLGSPEERRLMEGALATRREVWTSRCGAGVLQVAAPRDRSSAGGAPRDTEGLTRR